MKTAALFLAGFVIVAYAITGSGTRAYLWLPGLVLMLWGWWRLVQPPSCPRCGGNVICDCYED